MKFLILCVGLVYPTFVTATTCPTRAGRGSADCAGHGVCVDGFNFGDPWSCTSCDQGYSGAFCNIPTSTPVGFVAGVANSAFCSGQGTSLLANGINCRAGLPWCCACNLGFAGDVCQTATQAICPVGACANGGTCTNGAPTFSCQCAIGFTGPWCGTPIPQLCTPPVTPSTQCGFQGTCIPGATIGNYFTCQCFPGRMPPDCTTVFTCPADVSTSTYGTGAAVSYNNPTLPAGRPYTIIRVAGYASGSVFPVGDTTVSFQVQDGFGNTGQCTMLVRVTQVTAPTYTGPTYPAYNMYATGYGQPLYGYGYPTYGYSPYVTGPPLTLIGTAPISQYGNYFAPAVGAYMGIDPSRIYYGDYFAGSTVVSFYFIGNTSDAVVDTNSTQKLEFLLEDPTEESVGQLTNRFISTIQADIASSTPSDFANSFGVIEVNVPPAASSESSVSIAKVVAAFSGGVVLTAAIILAIVVVKSRRPTSNVPIKTHKMVDGANKRASLNDELLGFETVLV